MGVDNKIQEANEDYRLYKVDSSIEGVCTVWLTLRGQARDDWFLQGDVINATGTDIRPSLYITGEGYTFEEALDKAISKMKVFA